MQTARSPHGAGRRQRAQGLVRRRQQPGGSTTPTATAVEVKEASPHGSGGVLGRRGGWGLRVPFAPAFPGVGLAPTQVVSQLPEGAAPPQGAPDIFPLASSSSSTHPRSSSNSSSHGTIAYLGEGYDSDASTVVSSMEEDEDEEDDGPPPPMPCAFGRTQRVYVEREEGPEEQQQEEEEEEQERSDLFGFGGWTEPREQEREEENETRKKASS